MVDLDINKEANGLYRLWIDHNYWMLTEKEVQELIEMLQIELQL